MASSGQDRSPASRYVVKGTDVPGTAASGALPPLSSTVLSPASTHARVPGSTASPLPLAGTPLPAVRAPDSPPRLRQQSFRTAAAKERATNAALKLLGAPSRRGSADADEDGGSTHSGSYTMRFNASGEVCDDLHASRPDAVSHYEWCHSKDEFVQSPTGGPAGSPGPGQEETKDREGANESQLGNDDDPGSDPATEPVTAGALSPTDTPCTFSVQDAAWPCGCGRVGWDPRCSHVALTGHSCRLATRSEKAKGSGPCGAQPSWIHTNEPGVARDEGAR